MKVYPTSGAGRVAFWLALLFLGVAVAEGVVRFWVYNYRDPAERFNRETRTFDLVPGEHPRPGGLMRVGAEGFAGPALRPAPALRIAALGDSCTIGEGDGERSYPAMLGRRLARRSPAIEVVNAGVSGLDSEQLARRLESVVLPHAPDVLLIYAGWNDITKRRPLSQGSPTALSQVSRAVDDLWLVRGLRKALFMRLRPKLRAPVTGAEGQTDRFRDFEPGFFEAALTEMIRRAQAEEIRVFVLTLPTVLRREMHPYDLQQARANFPYFLSADRLGDTLDLIEAYNRSIRRVGASEGAELIDLAERFGALDSAQGYFVDTMHPSRLGMELIAATVERSLAGSGALGAFR